MVLAGAAMVLEPADFNTRGGRIDEAGVIQRRERVGGLVVSSSMGTHEI